MEHKYTDEEYEAREKNIDVIEEYTGTLISIPWNEVSSDDIQRLVWAVTDQGCH